MDQAIGDQNDYIQHPVPMEQEGHLGEQLAPPSGRRPRQPLRPRQVRAEGRPEDLQRAEDSPAENPRPPPRIRLQKGPNPRHGRHAVSDGEEVSATSLQAQPPS